MENARTENSADGAHDLLLINLRTIGTHHCDQTVGEEAAQEIERLREQLRLATVDQAIAEAEANDVRRAVQAPRACTCHPDDRPDGPCRERYAASECQALAAPKQPAAVDGSDAQAAEIEALRAEVSALREALALLPDEHDMIEHNPDEGPRMACCGREVKVDWLHGSIRTHDEDCWYARMRALRDEDQENKA